MAITTLRLPCKPHLAKNTSTILKGRTPVATFDGRNNPTTFSVKLGTLGEDRPIYIQHHTPERPAVKDPEDYLISLETTETLDINRSMGQTFGPHWDIRLKDYGFVLEPNGDWRLYVPAGEFGLDSSLLLVTLYPIL